MQYNPQDYTAVPASSSHPTVRNRPRYKDLRYDGKSNWKAFLHKFVSLSRSQQWNETEQHDHFCFFLEGPASEYYTLMLETTPLPEVQRNTPEVRQALWLIGTRPHSST